MPSDNNIFEINEQCLLIDYMTHIANLKGNYQTSRDRTAGGNSNNLTNFTEATGPAGDTAQEAYLHILKVHPDQTNYDFLDRINVPYSSAPLLHQLPKEFMSSLQPYFKMYKVFFRDENDRHGVKVLFPFNNFKDQSFRNRPAWWAPVSESPGSMAVGFKGMTLDYLGTNPATVDAFVNCGMTLYASTVHALFKEYPLPSEVSDILRKRDLGGANTPVEHYSFIDLISPPPRFLRGSDGHQRWNPRYFRVLMEIGYTQPTDEMLNSVFKGENARQKREDFRTFLEESKVVFYLTLKRHKLKLIPDTPSAPVELEVSFNASIEEATNSVYCDLLEAADKAAPRIASELDPNPEYIRITESRFGPSQVNVLVNTSPARILKNWYTPTRTTPVTPAGTATVELDIAPFIQLSRQLFHSDDANPFENLDLAATYLLEAGLSPQQQDQRSAVAFYPDGTPMFGPWRVAARPAFYLQGLSDQDINLLEDIVNFYFWSALGAQVRLGKLSRSETRRYVLFRELLDRLVGRPSTDRGGVLLTEWYQAFNDPTLGAFFPYKCDIFSQRVKTLNMDSDVLFNWSTQRKRMKFDDETVIDIQRALRTGDPQRAQDIKDTFGRRNINPAQQSLNTRTNNPFREPFTAAGTLFETSNIPFQELEENDSSSNNQEYADLYEAAEDEIRAGSESSEDRSAAESPTAFPRFSGMSARVPKTNPSDGSGPTNFAVRWLYFGDIIDNAIEFISTHGSWTSEDGPQLHPSTHLKAWNRKLRTDESHQGNLKFVMGKMPYVDYLTGETRANKTAMDLARFPVSFRSYTAFLKRYLVESKRLTFTLDFFIKKALQELVIDPMNRTCKIDSMIGDIVWEPIIEHATIPLSRINTTEIIPSIFNSATNGPANSTFPGGTVSPRRHGPENWFSPELPFTDPSFNARQNWTGAAPPSPALARNERARLNSRSSSAIRALSQANFELCNDLSYLIRASDNRTPLRMDSPFTTTNGQSLAEENIYFIGVRAETVTGPGFNDREKDIDAGVVYLDAYREGSPIYTVNFDRVDQPYVAEARAQMSGIGSDAFFQREFYNATVTTVGNTVLKAGKYAHITIPHFGDINKEAGASVGAAQIAANNATPARKLGVGGYYFIYKTQHNFRAAGDRLEWKTVAFARWNGFGRRVILI